MGKPSTSSRRAGVIHGTKRNLRNRPPGPHVLQNTCNIRCVSQQGETCRIVH